MKQLLTLFMATCISMGSTNAQGSFKIKHFNLEKGIAIKGYDPVAYFIQNKAVKGNSQFSVTIESVTYYFSSAAYRDIFIKDNKKYEPQYGGWCAYAMGTTGDKVEIDPETFKITNGKLFLFYHTWVNNTLNKWNKDEINLKNNADKNWQSLYH